MARRTNYKFERMERDRAKAAKKEARRQQKADRRAAAKGETPPTADAIPPEDSDASTG